MGFDKEPFNHYKVLDAGDERYKGRDKGDSKGSPGEFVREGEGKIKELSLPERVIRVEEELKSLKEIELARFEAFEKHFEALQNQIQVLSQASEKRFEALQNQMQTMFQAFEKRFEATESRLEALQREMDVRFNALNKRLNFTQWLVVIGFTLIGTLITLVNILK